MDSTYFRVARQLRQEARQWWYHQELRAQGNLVEARKRESQNVRGHIYDLRQAFDNGGWLSIGRGGAILYYHEDASLHFQGHNYQWVIDAGLLTVDTRTIASRRVVEVALRWPVPVVQSRTRDVVPFEQANSLSYVRIRDMLPHYRAAGATILND